MLSCALIFLTGCNAKLWIPDGVGGEGAALEMSFAFGTVRQNDCYPVLIELQDKMSAKASPALALGVSLFASGVQAVVYDSLEGCTHYSEDSEKQQFYLSDDQPRFTAYVRANQTGTLSLAAKIVGTSIQAVRKDVPVTLENFNTTRGLNGPVVASALDTATGKRYWGGTFTTFDSSRTPYLTRLNSDGTRDDAFVQAGTGLDNGVKTIAVQADGRVLVGGSFVYYNGTLRARIARLNSDGSLDTGFALAGTGLVSGEVNAIAIQSDGKILVAGSFTDYNGTARPRIARLNSDGSLDLSFAQTGSGLNVSVSAIEIQPDGKILVGGSFNNYNGTSRPYVARLNADGTLDPSFALTGTGFSSIVYAIKLQADGKLVVGGNFTSYDGTTRRYVARLNSDGTLDSGFAPAGTGLDNIVISVQIQPDGKICLGGSFASYNGSARPFVARLNSNGTLDTSFVQAGVGLSSDVYVLDIQTDGKLVTGGLFSGYNGSSRPFIARLNSDGTLDSSFAGSPSSFNNSVETLVRQPDGKILAGGRFTVFNGAVRSYIARLNADGGLDTTFTQTGAGLNSNVSKIALQNDGKILVGGNFYTYDATLRPYVARLNADGTLDTSFVTTGTGLDGTVNALAVQPDGKILVGGSFISYDSIPCPYLARLNADGTLDGTFNQTGAGLDGGINALVLQNDGKVVVAGTFTNYNMTAVRHVARLNSDGTLDSSFSLSGSGFNFSPFALALQSDGKILVGGMFSSYNGVTMRSVSRLNDDGSLDYDFSPTGTGFSGFVSAVAVGSDGKVLVGGTLSSYNGTSLANLARLNSDGSLDATLTKVGTGLNGQVSDVLTGDDGKILVGGGFTAYNSLTAPYLNRLTAIGSLD